MSNNSTNAPEHSVDYDFFSRIHDMPLGEKGNKDREEYNDKETVKLQEKKEEEKNNVEHFADAANQAYAEQVQKDMDKMYNINGYQFSNEALDETISEAISDKEAWAENHGISEEEAQSDITFLIALDKAAPEERKQMLQERAKTHPESANRIMQDAADKEQKLEQKRNNRQDFEEENPDTKSSTDLTTEEQTEKIEVESDGFDDLGFGDAEDINPTSMAKTLSQEETTTISMKSDFSQAVDVTIADTNIPTQAVTAENQIALNV